MTMHADSEDAHFIVHESLIPVIRAGAANALLLGAAVGYVIAHELLGNIGAETWTRVGGGVALVVVCVYYYWHSVARISVSGVEMVIWGPVAETKMPLKEIAEVWLKRRPVWSMATMKVVSKGAGRATTYRCVIVNGREGSVDLFVARLGRALRERGVNVKG